MKLQFLSVPPSFSEMLEKFRNGVSSPREYLEMHIDRIEHNESKVKAFACLDLDAARMEADKSSKRYHERQPLSRIDGMPLGIKDVIDTSNLPTQMNSPLFRDYRPLISAPSVSALKNGGAVIVGKTVTTEFAFIHPGPTTNPHNSLHTPGGSSSGSAAGAAAGMFPAALGTQTQGSTIRPAGYCGVIGYKPSFGVLSTEGMHPLSRTHDHLGFLGNSLQDIWSIATVIGENAPAPGARGLLGGTHSDVVMTKPKRLGVLRTDAVKGLDADSEVEFDRMLEAARDAGANIVEASESKALAMLVDYFNLIPKISREMVLYDMRWPYMEYIQHYPDKVSSALTEIMDPASIISRDTYQEHLCFRRVLNEKLSDIYADFDGFLLPSSSGPAPLGLDSTGDSTMATYASFLGLPALSLPVMSVSGLPFGLQIISHYRQDFSLFCLGSWLLHALRDQASK